MGLFHSFICSNDKFEINVFCDLKLLIKWKSNNNWHNKHQHFCRNIFYFIGKRTKNVCIDFFKAAILFFISIFFCLVYTFYIHTHTYICVHILLSHSAEKENQTDSIVLIQLYYIIMSNNSFITYILIRFCWSVFKYSRFLIFFLLHYFWTLYLNCIFCWDRENRSVQLVNSVWGIEQNIMKYQGTNWR